MKQPKLTFHRGLDYACIMREGDTTDTAFVQVMYPNDEGVGLLRQMAAAPQMWAALIPALRYLEIAAAQGDKDAKKIVRKIKVAVKKAITGP